MRLSNIVERFWYSCCRPRLSQASSPRQGAISSIFSTTAKNLVFHFTDDIRIDTHVQDICRKVYIAIQRISSIHHLSIDASNTLLSAFVLPKLDYCNSLFYGSPRLERLQKVQNLAARLFFKCCKKSHFTPSHGCPLRPV